MCGKIVVLTTALFLISNAVMSDNNKELDMVAKGEFDVELMPQTDAEFTAGRMTIDKVFRGDLQGRSEGQMLSHSTAVEGSAGYVAIERVTGKLQGKQGSFYLQHSGIMDKGQQRLLVTVIPDSGTEELQGLQGEMDIIIEDGKHYYEFHYNLNGND